MNFDQFSKLVHDVATQYYAQIERRQIENKVFFDSPILYPSMMIVQKFKNHYIAEFLGLTRTLANIKIIKVRNSDADQYFHLVDQV